MYNVIASCYDGDGFILYNTKNQTCIALTKEEKQEYDAISQGRIGKGELFDRLYSLDLLSVDRKTELGSMRHAFERSKFENEILELQVYPTLDFQREGDVFGVRREGLMSQDVQDCLIDYVGEQFKSQPYRTLLVEWVVPAADEQSLSVVERSNGAFQRFANEVDVEYIAMATIVGDVSCMDLQDRLMGCGISEIIPFNEARSCRHTVDQFVEGDDFVVDIAKGEIKDFFNQEEGLDLSSGAEIVNENIDFSLSFNLTNFDLGKKDQMDLLKERGMKFLKEFLEEEPTKEDFESLLSPLSEYCDATPERSYAIDELGNAYVCSRDLGKEGHVLFSLCEPMDTRRINMKLIAKYGIANPLNLKECSQCNVYPLCMGGCARVRVGDEKLTCIPQRFVIQELLSEYSRVLD